MLGHSRIGNAIRKAGMFGELDLPFMLQNVGGEITRTMTVQMHAAFKTATWHTHCDAETWKDDVVVRTIDPTNGMVPVPEGPGLGVEIDPEKLERLEKQKLPKITGKLTQTHQVSGRTRKTKKIEGRTACRLLNTDEVVRKMDNKLGF